jgi:hydroxymethylbilane synthase
MMGLSGVVTSSVRVSCNTASQTYFALSLPNPCFSIMTEPPIRIATRKSPLAIWQAEWVASELTALGHQCLLVPLSSLGDSDLRPITSSTEVGLFTKRIQQAVIDGHADIAVHSLKDLPTVEYDTVHVAAIPPRADVHDRLISGKNWGFDDIPTGAIIGTSSRRRAAQLLHARPDLDIRPIRGNVQTRIDQVTRGDFDATILAAAGLDRLDLPGIQSVELDIETMLPAPGQGALGIETRRNDERITEIVSAIDHASTRAAVTAERSLLRHLSGGCLAPIAAFARVSDDRLFLSAVVLSTDGLVRLHHAGEGEPENAKAIGEEIADALRAAGADRWIAAAR